MSFRNVLSGNAMRKNTYKTFRELIDNLSGFLGDLPQHIAHSEKKKVAEYKKQRNCLFAEDHLYKSPFSRRTIFFWSLSHEVFGSH
jgi:hypothetical protein